MIFALLLISGLAFGSFVNAFVWRLHQLESNKKLSRKQKSDLSYVNGRSMCIHCRHELAWYDLLPLMSWFLLKGKCRYCNKPISWQYPAVEAVTAGLFVLSYATWPYDSILHTPYSILLFISWLVFIVGFVALAVYDIRWMLLPNKIVYSLTAVAIVQVILKGIVTGQLLSAISGAFLGFLIIGGLFYLLFQVSGGKWIGGGDVKLAFMIGPLVGSATGAFMVIFLASLLGTLISLPFVVKNSLRMNARIPFGPFLLIATFVVYLYGEKMINWYSRMLVG